MRRFMVHLVPEVEFEDGDGELTFPRGLKNGRSGSRNTALRPPIAKLSVVMPTPARRFEPPPGRLASCKPTASTP